jgi:plasmid maintenance system antidote protein VapI
MAVRPEMVFGASAASWLRHQAALDLWQLQQQRRDLAKQVTPIKYPHNQTCRMTQAIRAF